jgi:hypothetical protein
LFSDVRVGGLEAVLTQITVPHVGENRCGQRFASGPAPHHVRSCCGGGGGIEPTALEASAQYGARDVDGLVPLGLNVVGVQQGQRPLAGAYQPVPCGAHREALPLVCFEAAAMVVGAVILDDDGLVVDRDDDVGLSPVSC